MLWDTAMKQCALFGLRKSMTETTHNPGGIFSVKLCADLVLNQRERSEMAGDGLLLSSSGRKLVCLSLSPGAPTVFSYNTPIIQQIFASIPQVFAFPTCKRTKGAFKFALYSHDRKLARSIR